MEPSDHTFPLPDVEAHKLDVAQHELEVPQEIPISPAAGFFESNKWPLLIAGALGIGIGLALRRRRR